MNFLKRIFSANTEYFWPEKIRFGRYSDAFKSEEKYDAWDKAMRLFEEGKFIESYKLFFFYLLDENEKNVRTELTDKYLDFEVLQGSKMINGRIADPMIKAEAKVAKTNGLNIGMLRKMLELNYTLKFSRYALDGEQNLTLIFDSFLLDGSPYKMYYALKEIAVSADKQDDLLIKEFSSLEPINNSHIEPLRGEVLAIKLDFLRSSIRNILDQYDKGKLNRDQYAGAFGYTFLDLAYRLDYLVKPEGALTELLENIHKVYFDTKERSSSEKNSDVRAQLEKILGMPDEEITAGMYDIPATFGITAPGTHEQLVSVIDNELRHMDWFVDNGHESVGMAFPGYIAGFSLFNYAFEPAIKFLLHLYFHVTENSYFTQLGFQPEMHDADTGGLDKRAIVGALETWRDQNSEKYPKLKFDDRDLKFSSMSAFAKSYFLMIRGLDFTKAS